jgi:uncharacterized phiE125 gp8 family phage protein
MDKYTQDDVAIYTRQYVDGNNNITLPDMDANLRWEFRDSGGVLRFTATTTSTPAIVAGTDAVSVTGIPLTAFALGVVQVSCYANVGGLSVFPSPELAYAFEVVASDSMVDQLRDILRLDDSSQDVYLLALIESAAEYASKYLGRTLLNATRVKQFDMPVNRGLSRSELKYPTLLLAYPPVGTITRVYAKDVDGEETDIDSDDYWLDGVSDPPELQLNDWNWEGKLRVIYTCGYGADYSDLPDSIQRGILLHAAYMFKYRGDCPDGESAEKSGAISAYRIFRVVRR